MSLMIDDENVHFIKAGKYAIKLDKSDLDDETRAKSESELRERPEVVEKALEELRALISEEPNLYVPHEIEEYLIKFLRPCKFYSQSSFEQMKRFYNFKRNHPKLCDNLLPANERNVFAQGIIRFQELRDKNGCRFMILHTGQKWKPSKCSLDEIFRGVQLALEAAMVEPKTQVNGVVVLIDMKGFSLNHVVQFTPSFAKMIVDWIQDCIPLRLKGVHLINQPYIFNMVFALFKPFLREKLRNRIHFHGENRQSLLKHVPSEALLPEYGGAMDMPEYDGNVLCDLLCKYEEDFKLADSFGYDKNHTSS